MDISLEELIKKNQNNKLNIIDIRDQYSYEKSHIIGAKNIPFSKLMREPESYLNYQETYYIYCYSGNTSQKVVHILHARGYHVFNIQGGFKNYLLRK